MRYILTIILFAFIMSCSEHPEPVPYDFTKKFTGDVKRGWTIRSYQYLEEGKGTQTGRLDDCLADDLYIFFANEERRMEMRDSHQKCNADDPDLITEGTWGFSNSGATLTMPFPLLSNGPVPFILREMEADHMTLEIFFNDDKSSYRFNFRSAEIE
jgi:hypothetical protein